MMNSEEMHLSHSIYADRSYLVVKQTLSHDLLRRIFVQVNLVSSQYPPKSNDYLDKYHDDLIFDRDSYSIAANTYDLVKYM